MIVTRWLAACVVAMLAGVAHAQFTGGPVFGGRGVCVQYGGTSLGCQAFVNFDGAGVSCVADVANARTTCTISGGGGGGGTDVALDLGDDGANESTAITEIATTGDTNSIFSEPSANKLLIAVGNDWPKADTADDLTCTNCIGPTEITDLALGTDTTGSYVLSVATSSPLTGGAAGSEGAILTLGCQAASGSQAGCLASADWTTFNNKQAGPLTGDVVTSGAAATIQANSVALTIDTTGDYVASFTAGAGLTGNATGEGSTPTIDVVAGNASLLVAAGDVRVQLQAATDALSATTSSGSGLEVTAGGLTLLQGCSDGQQPTWVESTDTWDCGAAGSGGGGMTSFTLAGDSGTVTITDGNTATIATGAGLTSVAAATDTVTISVDANGITGSMIDEVTVDHNTLNNLTAGDPHTQYFKLTGRSGGQVGEGGTAAGDSLTLKPTSASPDTITGLFTGAQINMGASGENTSTWFSRGNKSISGTYVPIAVSDGGYWTVNAGPSCVSVGAVTPTWCIAPDVPIGCCTGYQTGNCGYCDGNATHVACEVNADCASAINYQAHWYQVHDYAANPQGLEAFAGTVYAPMITGSGAGGGTRSIGRTAFADFKPFYFTTAANNSNLSVWSEGLSFSPQFLRVDGTNASTSPLVSGLTMGGNISTAGWTADNWFAVTMNNPSKHASSTITDLGAVEVADLTNGSASGETFAVRSAISAGTHKHFLLSTGNAQNKIVGKTRLGDTTAPSNQLEVIGASSLAATMSLDASGTTTGSTTALDIFKSGVTVGLAGSVAGLTADGTFVVTAAPSGFGFADFFFFNAIIENQDADGTDNATATAITLPGMTTFSSYPRFNARDITTPALTANDFALGPGAATGLAFAPEFISTHGGTGVAATVVAVDMGSLLTREPDAGWAIEDWYGLRMRDPGGAATIDDIAAVRCEALAEGAVSNACVDSAITAASGRYFVRGAGAQSVMGGKVAVGSTTDPVEALDVTGHARILASGGTAQELRFLEASGSEYASFKAPSLSATTNYTLPTDDGSSGEVLSTDGAGVLDWVAVSGSGMSFAKKTSNQTTNTDTTLNADSALVVALAASTNYFIRGTIYFNTPAAADFKWRHSGPASPTLVRVSRRGIVGGGTAFSDIAVDTAYSAADVALTGSGTDGMIYFEANIQNGSNAGNFEFQWAQNTSNGSNTTVYAGSMLEYVAY